MIDSRGMPLPAYPVVIGGTVSKPVPDIQAPSIPDHVSAVAVSNAQINLSWAASTDNVGVAGYRVYRNGAQVAVPVENFYSDAGLATNTPYHYAVAAVDFANNISAQSSVAHATTTAGAPTLAVSLAVSPNSGTVPFGTADFRVAVSGTATGPVSATFYCHRPDAGTDITLPFNAQIGGTLLTSYLFQDPCLYAVPGTYKAKVIVKRGSLSAQAQATVIASAAVAVPPLSSGGGSDFSVGRSISVPQPGFSGHSESSSGGGTLAVGSAPSNAISDTLVVKTDTGMPAYVAAPATGYAALLAAPLRPYAHSPQVAVLQELLSVPPAGGTDIYPEKLVTGYYGILTLKAIQRFQKKHGIVSSGDPASTGYGMAGRRTVAKINELVQAGNVAAASPDVPAGAVQPPHSIEQTAILQRQLEAMQAVLQQLIAQVKGR